jgi:putative transposase
MTTPYRVRPKPKPAGARSKPKLLPGGSPFASLEEARLEIAWYLDTYFNLDRRHSALGYRSPHQFEHDLKTNLP